MKELNKFIEFLVSHKDDERVTIHRKMKYGFKHLYIDFYSDTIDKQGNPFYRPQLAIIFDNRNKCIEVANEKDSFPVIIQDDKLLSYWTEKLDKLLDGEIEPKIQSAIENCLISCENKNLHREYLMKKIIDDESI